MGGMIEAYGVDEAAVEQLAKVAPLLLGESS
jgi:hypothetical protein